MTYDEAVEFADSTKKYGSILGLESIRNLMQELGNVQEQLHIIHVAGTNGKGSVCAFLSAALTEAGYRVGRYNSPAVFERREVFRIGETMISKEEYTAVFERVQTACEVLTKRGCPHPTVFEVETAAAFLWFYEKKCDLVLLETGMGGETDATNLITHPVCSVLTSIGMDHMQYLGNTIEEIAREKAGIIKAGVPVVIAPQESEALAVLQRAAAAKGVRARCVQEKDLQGAKALQPGLLGAYQRENAATAMCAAQVAWTRCRIEKEKMKTVIARGIHRAVWPGRMEILSTEPFLMVDGAHNSNGIHALCTSLEELYPEEKFHFVMGVMADKDYEKMIGELLPIAMDFVTVTPESARALQGETLAEDIRKQGVPAHAITKVAEIPELLTPKEKTIALGSLYFIGELKSVYQNRT